MTAHKPLRFCAGCRRPLPVTAPDGTTHCDAPLCQTRSKVVGASALATQRSDYEIDLRKRTLQRADAAVQEAKARFAEADPAMATAPVVVEMTPYIDPGLAPLSKERHAEFVEHLDAIIAEAFVYGPPKPEPLRGWEAPTDLKTETRKAEIDDEPLLMTAACIACQGDCCMQARAHFAFLTVHTIRTLRQVNPDLTPEEIKETYLDLLPEASVQRSCLYHGPVGCTLPRTIRAGICNRWECGHRKRLRRALEETGAEHVVIAGVTEDHTQSPEAGADVLRVVAANKTEFQIHADLRPDALPPKPPNLGAFGRNSRN